MSISRRKFLAAAPLAVGAILPVRSLALDAVLSKEKGGARAAGDALSHLPWDSFYPYVTTDFSFTAEGTTAALTLSKMTDTRPSGYAARAEGQECFALTFVGPSRRPLAENTYQVEHFALGTFALFITVVGKTKRGVLYEAVINRIVG